MGSTAEVGWVSVANHAGGYSWSLCRAGQPLTEDSFDLLPLQFATNTSKLRYMFLEEDGSIGPNRTEVTIPAHRVTEGVLPKGSMWSKNPVPAGSWGGSWFGEGGPGSEWQGNQEPPQFEPPAGCDSHCWGYQPCNVGFTHPSYEGWDHTKPEPPNCSRASAGAPLANGEGCCHTTAYMAILDEVHVPKVPPGDYVVRWRWVRRNRHSLVLRALLFASSERRAVAHRTANSRRRSGADAAILRSSECDLLLCDLGDSLCLSPSRSLCRVAVIAGSRLVHGAPAWSST